MKREERTARLLSYAFPIFTAAVMYAGCLWISAGTQAAILSAALFLWSDVTVVTDEIAPHQLFVLCTMASLILLLKWRASGERRCWYGSLVAAACAFCTLEVAFVLVFLLALCAIRAPSIPKSILVFLSTVGLIWPAALAKLSFVKAYLFMAYLAVFRPAAWGDTGLLEAWRHRIGQSPAEWTVLALAAVVYFRPGAGSFRKQFMLVVFYGCLMLLVLARVNSETPRYLLPFLPVFQLAAGCTFSEAIRSWSVPIRWAAVLAILGVVFFGTLAAVRAHPVRPSPRLDQVLAAVREANLDGKTLVAPQSDVPMIHYYFPRVVSRGYADARERQAEQARADWDAILAPGVPVALRRRSLDPAHYVSH